ncbi:MAG: FtsH protease activity modulator HflK [Clostridiales bacterium]|nr:FtsH protease activity modulator HflK [Clostridiales bacterium]
MENNFEYRRKAQENLKKLKKLLVFVPVVLLVLILVVSSVYKVNTGEAAVITRFGSASRVVNDAGIHFKAPFIESANMVSLAKRHQIEYGYRTLSGFSNMQTSDYQEMPEEQIVIVEAVGNNSSLVLTELIVEYRVLDPINYLYKVDDLENTIRLVLEDTLRNTLQSVTLDQALTDKLSIDGEIKPEIQRKLNSYEAGVDIIEVKTQNTSLLDSVDTAYREVEKANQYRNGKIEEAQKYTNTVVPKAESEATQLIEGAKAHRARVIAQANAEVAEFQALYAEYVKNPQIIRERIYIDSMREFIANNNVIIDTTSGGNLYKIYNMDDDNTNGNQSKSSTSNKAVGSDVIDDIIEEEQNNNDNQNQGDIEESENNVEEVTPID